jgi:aminopeptidase-like protein
VHEILPILISVIESKPQILLQSFWYLQSSPECIIRYASDVKKDELYSWVEHLYPLNRSIIGDDYDFSLTYLAEKLNCDFKILEFHTGQVAGSWTVPKGWSVNSAYIKKLNGEVVLNFSNSNLHVWSHSQSISGIFSREDLFKHLASLPSLPNAIPYRTTYYEENWGFSLQHNLFETMLDDHYEVFIDAEFYDHSIKVLEVLIPGKYSEEIIFSSYLCHPSMVSNELSGPTILIALANEVLKGERTYSYRFIIAPETIGPIFYLNQKLDELRAKIIMGWNLTCLGDSKAWSILHSRNEDSLVDKISRQILHSNKIDYKSYSFAERGSDERQYSSPLVGIPMTSIMRSKYTEYPEYHTSLDNLDFVSPDSLFESFCLYRNLVGFLDFEGKYFSSSIGEPFLLSYFDRKKRGGEFSGYSNDLAAKVNSFVAYSNGNSLVDIANELNIELNEAMELAILALERKLVTMEPHVSQNKS